MELAIISVTRLVLGLMVGFFAGFMAFLLGWTVIFRGTQNFAVLTPGIVTMVSIGAGIGVGSAWLVPGGSRRLMAVTMAAAMVAGLGGGWIGFLLGSPEANANLLNRSTREVVQFEHPVQELFSRQGLNGALLGSMIGASFSAAAAYLVSARQTLEY